MRLPHLSPVARLRLLAVPVALTVAACSNGGDQARAADRKPRATTTSSTSTSTTAAPTTTSTTAAAPAPGFGRGSKGPEVQALEQQLANQKYDVGRVDGSFDAATGHAVLAFQKVHGLPRTSRATPEVLTKAASAGEPGALLPGGGATRVEVDLKRQVLFLYKGGALDKIVNISTGSGKRYCVDGQCATAVTPGGSYRITRRISGWRTSRLGKLYNPLYFNGGIAIHGAASVPAYPASHGCVRIPMHVAEWFPKAVPNGTPVYVVGGPKAPVPFNEPAPGEAPPNSSSSTSTTKPPTSTTAASPTTSTLPAPTTSTTSGVDP